MTTEQWRAYEQGVAAVFREAGLDADTAVPVQGARAVHHVDVMVSLAPRAGIGRLWLVECKDQRRNVTKSAVLTFRGVLEDTGAERGFLISEAAFQPAAIAATSLTNITLCSIATLRDELRTIRQAHQLGSLEARVVAVREQLEILADDTVYPPSHQHGALFFQGLNWKQWVHWSEGTSRLMKGLVAARADEWPAKAGITDPLNAMHLGEALTANDADEFVRVAETFLRAAEDWTDAAHVWLDVDERDVTDEIRALAARLRRAFVAATWTPPRSAAGPVRGEALAAKLLLSSADVGVGYHETHTSDGIPWRGIDRSLYFVLDGLAKICLAAEHWSEDSASAQPRLVLERTHGEVSAIEVRTAGLGQPIRIVFLANSSGVETGALVEFANGSIVHAWVVGEGEVRYSLDGFPVSAVLHRSRELVR